ncbi:MAG: hypothetical protein QJR09_08310 [Micrococcus sp.]|nr:hypothetical protein [Micrococcus sp.]
MGESTVEHRDRTAHRSRTALYLALPAAVAVRVLGTLGSSLLIGALVSSASSPSLATVFMVFDVGISLAVLALCGAAVPAHVTAERPGRPRHRARTLAWSALAASLVLGAVYSLLWHTGLADGLVMAPHVNTVMSALGLLLAALALLAGVAAAIRAPERPGRPGRPPAIVAAVATPAALLTPVAGMLAGSAGAHTVAAYAGVVLAAVGLGAAVVALRRESAGTAAPAARRAAGGTGEADSRGRRCLRYLATPLALLALGLAVPALAADDDGALAVLALATAFALALAAIAGAVLDVRAERRAGRVRVAAGLAAGTVPLAVTVVPVAVALATVSGDESGWAVLGALFVSVPLAAVVALLGLVAAIVAASARQYAGRAAATSVLCTALIPVALLLFVPLQAAGAAVASAVLAGLLLLAALVTGLAAVGSGGARGDGSPRAGTPAAPADAAPQNPYR